MGQAERRQAISRQAPKHGAMGPSRTPEAGIPLSISPGMKPQQPARGQGPHHGLHRGDEWSGNSRSQSPVQ